MGILDNKFLDSGAFSVWTRGVDVNLEDYIKFLQERGSDFEVCANLDVIGNGQASFENWKIMSKAGLDILPVYHIGTDEKYLKKYLEKTNYVALGSGVITKMSMKMRVRAFGYIWDKYLRKDVKVHGFGITAIPLLMRFPWYSVDSTAWSVLTRYGKLFIPYRKKGEWKYDETPFVVKVGMRDKKMGRCGGITNTGLIGSLSPLVRVFVMEYMEEKGFSLGEVEYEKMDSPEEGFGMVQGRHACNEIIVREGLITSVEQRVELNFIYFLELLKYLKTLKKLYFAGALPYQSFLEQACNKHAGGWINNFGILFSYYGTGKKYLYGNQSNKGEQDG